MIKSVLNCRFPVAYNVAIGGSDYKNAARHFIDGAVEGIDGAGHKIEDTLCAVDLQLLHIDDNRLAALEVIDDVLRVLIADGMINDHLHLCL